MLSLTPRRGAGRRCWTGARALASSLALAATLAAAAPSSPPARPAAATPAAATSSEPARTDPDATLQRLAEEAERIDPSSPGAVARLRTVLRGLIEVERASRREIAALRSEVAILRSGTTRDPPPPAPAADRRG